MHRVAAHCRAEWSLPQDLTKHSIIQPVGIEPEKCAWCGSAISAKAQAHIRGDQIVCARCNRKKNAPAPPKDPEPLVPARITTDGNTLRVKVYQYEMSICGREMTIFGPNDEFSKMIGRRLLNVMSTNAGPALLANQEAQHRLCDVLHVRPKSSMRPATDNQKAYAEGLGYQITDSITFDEISFLLDDFEQVRFYVYFVFRSLHGCTPSEAGIDSAQVSELTMEVIRDEKLTAQVLCLRVIQDATGEDLETSGIAFETVANLIRSKWLVRAPSGAGLLQRLFGRNR